MTFLACGFGCTTEGLVFKSCPIHGHLGDAVDYAGQTLPADSAERKDIPMARGLLDYFPAALAEVARLSLYGNNKHNPGEELHHARDKSTDHADCIMRHLIERGTIDSDNGFSHSVMMAWRALALLQEEREAQGAPLARGARLGETTKGVPVEGGVGVN